MRVRVACSILISAICVAAYAGLMLCGNSSLPVHSSTAQDDSASQHQHGKSLPILRFAFHGESLTAEIASTSAQRIRGLMGRTEIPEDHGMLFVFPEPSAKCFWMHDTSLPLSVAFIGSDFRIAEIQVMQPNSDQRHCPSRPMTMALEMNQGWFDTHHVGVGDELALIL